MVRQVYQSGSINPSQLNERISHSTREQSAGTSFKEQLSKAGGLQFSKHAMERAGQRGIELTPALMNNLNQAVQKAKDKGAKDVVVIGQNQAFIVNIPNNVIVTTMSQLEMRNNVFTNIDSAVMM